MTMLHEAVAQYLGSAVTGLDYSETAATGNVFVDYLPQTPDRAVGVFSSPGPESNARLPYDSVDFQVLIRSEAGGQWARDMWAAIYSALHSLEHTTLSGVVVVYILGTTASPLHLGDDENGRPSYSGDFRSEVHNATVARP